MRATVIYNSVFLFKLFSNGQFSSVGESIRLPDDVTMGYIVEVLLGRPLTVLTNFHSHLESLGYIEQKSFREQISFSYSKGGNILSLSEAFDHRLDPTRFVQRLGCKQHNVSMKARANRVMYEDCFIRLNNTRIKIC